MAARLGNGVLWASLVIALALFWFTQTTLPSEDRDRSVFYAIAGIIVLIGIAVRYVLAGGKDSERSRLKK